MRNNKLIIGITGGSGAGKTTVSDAFAERGIVVIDADKAAREIVKPGGAALAQICKEFGDGVLLPDGTLDRKKLGSIVFSDKERLNALNLITHKYITEYIHDIIDKSDEKVFAVDGAVLFESGIADECDVMCAVTADEKMRISRITIRDGLTEDEAKKRIASQMSDSEYARCCRYVIDNSRGADMAKKRAFEVIDDILSGGGI